MKKYVIVSLRHKDMFFGGNAHLFWGSDRQGYTAVLQTAGLYTEEEAAKIANEDDVPINIDTLGFKEEFFTPTKSGFKELPQLVLINIENKGIDELIKASRAWFRQRNAG
ncbi:hypothetical protein ACHHV8_36550 [Paenibacillus sp. TAB 01]|uniref:hypothetical protein n=1 Tax=Paenibacillus sp. TAB 01 TaxID=3368988 RepID=UPI00375198F9